MKGTSRDWWKWTVQLVCSRVSVGGSDRTAQRSRRYATEAHALFDSAGYGMRGCSLCAYTCRLPRESSSLSPSTCRLSRRNSHHRSASRREERSTYLLVQWGWMTRATVVEEAAAAVPVVVLDVVAAVAVAVDDVDVDDDDGGEEE